MIAVQIENEAGIQGGTRRDFSPLGQAAYAALVPEELTAYCKDNPNCILAGVWKENGQKEGAAWADTFGYYGAEAVTAYAIAKYIDEICEAGKEIYPELFMYLNVWLGGGIRGLGQNLAGIDWPSGCATIHNLDIYYAVLKHIDTVAPDNYQTTLFRHREVSDAYAHPEKGFPLYVPESAPRGVNIGQMFYAFAEKKAIGYHIFGSESCLNPDFETPNAAGRETLHNYTMLDNVKSLLFDGGWQMRVLFGTNAAGDWPASDFRHRLQAAASQDKPEPGRMMVFQESEKVFYFVGENVYVTIEPQPPLDGSIPNLYANAVLMHTNIEAVSVTEGHFDENGCYVTDLVRSGDESRHSIWLRWNVGVVRVEMV